MGFDPISAAASVASSGFDLYKMGYASDEASFARDFGAQEAQKSRDFTERMSNTAYQRATADMKAAGINPMLAFSQGGASTPAGATAGTVNASVPNVNPVSSALEVLRTRKEMDLLDSQIKSTNAQAYKSNQEGDGALFDARLKSWTQKAIQDNFEEFQKGAIAPYLIQSSSVPSAKAEADFWTNAGQGGKASQFIMELLKGAKAVFGSKGGITINK